jgi:hypothetical protein
VPPPNWALRYPNGYTEENPPPDLKSDEHFQNWMRTAGLPTFTKLYGRNDSQTMQKGTYRIIIGLSKKLFLIECGLYTDPLFRLPRSSLQGYQINCHLDCVVDRRKEPFPWMGICCSGWSFRAHCDSRNSSTSHQAKVRKPNSEYEIYLRPFLGA